MNRRLLAYTCVSAAAALVTSMVVPAASATPEPANKSAASDRLEGDFIEAQWGLRAVRAQEAWTASKGADAVVAVIDTGADAKHPDLSGQLVDGAVAVFNGDKWEFEPVPAGDSEDLYGHGTHVSGIIVAKDDSKGVAGVAPEAKVMPINVLEAIDTAMSYEEIYYMLADAVRYSAAAEADVISMSLGIGGVEEIRGEPTPDWDKDILAAEQDLCDAISSAVDAGSLVVVAAGNSGVNGGGDNPPSRPATCEDSMSVAAAGPVGTAPTDWSSSDPTVAITAPGAQILSTMPVPASRGSTLYTFPYAEMSGTSMATPMVSGVAALIAASNPGVTPAQIRTTLESTATDIATPGKDSATGFGMLDAAAALNVDIPRTTMSTTPYLPLYVRPAYSTSPNRYTVVWAPPLGSVAPVEYQVDIADANSDNMLGSYTLSAEEVRVTFSAPKNTKAWVFLTAVYPDGSKVKATPTFMGTNSSFKVPVKGLDGKRTGKKFTITWKPIAEGLADVLYIGIAGPGIGFYEKEIKARKDGSFPTSTVFNLKSSVDPANTDYSIYAIPAVDMGGGVMLGSETVKNVFSNSPAALTAVAAPSGVGVVGVEALLNSNFYGKCEDGDCRGRTAKIDYRIQLNNNKGKVVKGTIYTFVDPSEGEKITASFAKPSRIKNIVFTVSVMTERKGKPFRYASAKPVKILMSR